MKYIDEKRMRLGYIGIFGLAVILIGAAFWDTTYNDERLINWFISALGGLLLIAIFFFVVTELILKDALDLRPKRVAAVTDQDYGMVPSQHQVATAAAPSRPEHRSMPAVPSTMMQGPAPPMRELSRPASMSSRMNRIEPWNPHVQAVAKAPRPTPPAPRKPERVEAPKREPMRIEMPKTEFIVAKPQEARLKEVLPDSPALMPKPQKIPQGPQGIHLEKLSYELGSSQFRVPRGTKGHINPLAVLESTRVLCSDCGLYFRVDLDRTRPMSVQCPQCSRDLGLSGARQEAQHVKMRCRFCGDFLQMPRVADHKATQCATCGQITG